MTYVKTTSTGKGTVLNSKRGSYLAVSRDEYWPTIWILLKAMCRRP